MENHKQVVTVFDKSQTHQKAYSLPRNDRAWESIYPPEEVLRKESIQLPEISELDLTRHFTKLSRKNMSIDTHFYPLGSCTMKLNPRINEFAAQISGFLHSHPFAPEETVEGNLTIIYELTEFLCRLCGMDGGTCVPNAGAQGEFVGLKMIRAYHDERGDTERDEVLVPDNAHGTNPASATLAGYKTVMIKTDPTTGDIDLDHLTSKVSKKTAALMLTNPNTLGLFSSSILTITEIVHNVGGLLYYDGANLNPILSIARPGDMGFDVMHINLHKTFSTPHGGGGPGGAPVLCKAHLVPFLPVPKIEKDSDHYNVIWNDRDSIGKVSSFFGNFSILVRAYLYIRLHGQYGLRKIAEAAIINANYMKFHLRNFFKIPFDRYCMHEFVLQADNYLSENIRALDIAKRLLDYGFHAPTIYFPLIVKECMLIEPTESESKNTLDQFIHAIQAIVFEIHNSPQIVLKAPHTTELSRLDDVRAAKELILKEE